MLTRILAKPDGAPEEPASSEGVRNKIESNRLILIHSVSICSSKASLKCSCPQFGL